MPADPTDDDARISLRWAHRQLRLPARTVAALEQLSHGGDAGVVVADLRRLDEREQLVLARRLLDEGALEAL
jgi:hypothetical protein